MKKGFLPWNGKEVVVTQNLSRLFSNSQKRYLPKNFRVAFDPEISEADRVEFHSRLAGTLVNQINHRLTRSRRFVLLSLLSGQEMREFLTARTGLQDWFIYYGKDGGLGDLGGGQRGCIPCSTMKNHGVAYQKSARGTKVWLATARKPGQGWDWDSDINHESAHAAFAPVPLFVQGDIPTLEGLTNMAQLSPGHVARLLYWLSEICVVALCGERRETETGLPIPTMGELLSFVTLSQQIFPTAGFEDLLQLCQRSGGKVDVDGDAMFNLAAPCMKVVSALSPFINISTPPSVEELSNLSV